MGFKDRIEAARIFENELFYEMNNLGFEVAKNGAEHTCQEFTKFIMPSSDQTSLAIRFAPDGVAAIGKTPRSFYVEAKYASNIEKTAYEQYMKLASVGNIVVLVFGGYGDWMWQVIERVTLIDGDETVSSFPENMRYPVIDGWITPRKADDEHYKERKHNNGGFSGTPYREVYYSSLLDWRIFKCDMLSILKRDYINLGRFFNSDVEQSELF